MNEFTYDPISGKLFWNIDLRNGKAKVGDEIVARNKGYIRVKLNGVYYLAHRIAWYKTYGDWPDRQIDHINRDRSDNRIVNLRLVDHRGNSHNRATFNGGSYFCKSRNRWRAKVRHNGSRKYLGDFLSEEEANNAYNNYLREHQLI